MYKIGRFIGLSSLKLTSRTLASIKLSFIYSFILDTSIKLEEFCGASNYIFTYSNKVTTPYFVFLGVPHFD
tara:strand:+ start:308 stop:520 length:213 start_codon:yes stop_codon:yes gene_type:complete